MSTSPPSRRVSAAKRNGTVGRESKGGGLSSLFIGSIIAVVIAFLVLVTVAVDAFSGDSGTPAAAPSTTDTPTTAGSTPTTAPATATTVPKQSPTAATTAEDGSIVLPCGNILVPLDKQHKLTADCAPTDLVTVKGGTQLRSEAAGAFNEMLAAASKAGFTLYANSAYRSYAERTSARAGHSEHQLGTTADVGARGLELEAFEGTPEAAWLAANSYKFGFIVSYPDGKEGITGYAPEPWHVRYVGKDVAQKVHDSGLTLHEYLLR